MAEYFLFRYFISVDTFRFVPGLSFNNEPLETAGDLDAKKNQMLISVLDSLVALTADDKKADQLRFRIRKEPVGVGLSAYRLAVFQTKGVEVSYKRQRFVNQPSFVIVVDNDPSLQTMLIEHNPQAYSDINKAAKKLEKIIKRFLYKRFLRFNLNPIYQAEEFWEILRRHGYQATGLKFEILAPNMPGLSNLYGPLADTIKNMNSGKTDIGMAASKGSVMTITKDNQGVKDLAKLSSEGGGDVAVRVKGEKKYRKVGKSVYKKELGDDDIPYFNHEQMLYLCNERLD